MDRPCIKIAEGKTTVPGATNIVRIIRNGMYEGDIICRAQDADKLVKNDALTKNITSYTVNSLNGTHATFNKGEEAYTLLQPIMKNGEFVHVPEFDLHKLQQRAKSNLAKLDDAYKRLANPHLYGVGMETSLFNLQQNLIKERLGR